MSEQSMSLSAIPTGSTIEEITKISNGIAKSDLIPKMFRGSPTNCLIAIQYSAQMRLPVLTVMNAMYRPKQEAKPGFSAEFYLGRLMASGRIIGTISYDMGSLGADALKCGQARLEDLACRATVTDRETNIEHSELVTMRMAIAQGWCSRGKKNYPTKYETMGPQMLKKRSATWLIRNHYPDVMQGCYESTEIDDIRTSEEAREVEVVSAAVDRLNTPPGARLPQEPQVVEAEAVPAKAEPKRPTPAERLTDGTEQVIQEWLNSEQADPKAVHAYIRETLECGSFLEMTEAEGLDLVEKLQSGEFEPVQE